MFEAEAKINVLGDLTSLWKSNQDDLHHRQFKLTTSIKSWQPAKLIKICIKIDIVQKKSKIWIPDHAPNQDQY